MEREPISEEERIQRRKYALQLPPAEPRDWPTMSQVQEEYPQLCGEEQAWLLEALIFEAHERRQNEGN